MSQLTAEQEKEMILYRDRAIANGKDTSEADWKKAETAVRQMVACANIDTSPQNYEVLFIASPIQAALNGHKKAKAIDGVGGSTLFQAASYGGGCARNNFFVEVLGVELEKEIDEKRIILDNFVKSCGGVYLHSKFSIIYDRPSVLRLVLDESSGVASLHCEDGPALAWGRDPVTGKYDPNAENGYSLYYWEGTEVPKHWIMDKPTTDSELKQRAQEILTNNNQEQMRAGCEILGWLPVLQALGMQVLEENPNPMFGKLVQVDLPDSPNSRFLIAQCGTNRTIAVPVSSEAKTAVEAGAMSYGVPVEVYKMMKVRT